MENSETPPEDEACVVMGVRNIGTVIAVVSTSLISVTGIQAAPEAVYRDEEVAGTSSTPEMTVTYVYVVYS